MTETGTSVARSTREKDVRIGQKERRRSVVDGMDVNDGDIRARLYFPDCPTSCAPRPVPTGDERFQVKDYRTIEAFAQGASGMDFTTNGSTVGLAMHV